MIHSGKTMWFTAMSAVAILFTGATALAVPVVPNFTQGSMTSHTETTQKITETINSCVAVPEFYFAVWAVFD